MTVTEIKQATGSWELRLRSKTPRAILEQLTYFGHIAVLPGRIDPTQFGDNLLRTARYVGVYRNRDAQDEFTLKGVGMAFWLGDEDGKGDIFESPVNLVAQTFAASIPALLPPGGAVLPGVINSVPGTYTGKHQWVTSRQALNYVTELFGAEYRVNGDATLDAGTVAQLYVTTPRAILLPKGKSGRDLLRASLAGKASMGTDVEDYTTRVVVLAEGEGTNIATGSADASLVPYKDIRGNPMKSTRLVSESETAATNADARAQLALNQFSGKRYSISLSTEAFDIKGDLAVGDYVDVFDPVNGYVDPTREVYWEGQPINPMALRCVEMSWPIPPEWTVAFRTVDGVWIDLSQYYAGETGETTLVVGDFNKSLTGIGSEDIGSRPNLPDAPGADSTLPAAPTFGDFDTGNYQSTEGTWTKAVILARWTQPLNQDGSTITDGDHYEVRYRVNAYLGYKVKWGELNAAPYKWGELGKWGAPISGPIQSAGEWSTIYVGWDSTEYQIMELTPGVEYEFQVRAADQAAHLSPWSASKFVMASGDLFEPSQPAAPAVASSRIAIQVVHTLGKSSGGTYNLEPDLSHLTVHIGNSADFTADDSNQVGKMLAAGGMITAQIPAVATFQVEQTSAVWVKVRAVDIAGNQSSASEGATATADLIDDAHISNLTVSKLTAGTMTAQIINAGQIVTATGGARMFIEGIGISTVNADNYVTTHLKADSSRYEFYEPNYSNAVVEVGITRDGNAGLRVGDLFGVAKVVVGQLNPAGGTVTDNYGIALVNDSGELTKLHDFVFGPKTHRVAPVTNVTNVYPTWGFGSGAPWGPDLFNFVVGETGRVMITLSATVEANANTCIMGLKITPAVGPAFDLTLEDCLIVGAGAYLEMGLSRTVFIDNLAPGAYHFESQYAVTGGTGFFRSRSLFIQPY